MNASSSLRWVGWCVLIAAVSMILSQVLYTIFASMGYIIPGTHSHSLLVESFDILATGFLLPVPMAFYLIYRSYAPRLSLLSLVIGTVALAAVTILHVLFFFEVLWFIDSIQYYLYVGIGLVSWLLISAYVAYKSQKPVHGTLMNLFGASLIGLPVWAIWLGYLFVTGRLAP